LDVKVKKIIARREKEFARSRGSQRDHFRVKMMQTTTRPMLEKRAKPRDLMKLPAKSQQIYAVLVFLSLFK